MVVSHVHWVVVCILCNSKGSLGVAGRSMENSDCIGLYFVFGKVCVGSW